MTFAHVMDQLRRELGLSQAAMAERLKVGQAAVSKFERGKEKPGTEVFLRAMKIARAEGGYIAKQFEQFITEFEDPACSEARTGGMDGEAEAAGRECRALHDDPESSHSE